MRAVADQAVRRPWLVILAWLAVLVLANLGGRLAHPPAPRQLVPAGRDWSGSRQRESPGTDLW